MPFIEYGAEELLTNALRDNRLIFTSKPSEISNSNGLVAVNLPAGTSNIYIRRDEPVGFATGLGIAVVLIMALRFLLRRSSKRN